LYKSILIITRSKDKALNLVKQRDIIIIRLISSKDILTLFENKLRRVDDYSNNSNITTKLLVVLEFMLLAII